MSGACLLKMVRSIFELMTDSPDHDLVFSPLWLSEVNFMTPVCFQWGTWGSKSIREQLWVLQLTSSRSGVEILAPETKSRASSWELATWHHSTWVVLWMWPWSRDKLCPFLVIVRDSTNYLPKHLIKLSLYLAVHDLVMEKHGRNGPCRHVWPNCFLLYLEVLRSREIDFLKGILEI